MSEEEKIDVESGKEGEGTNSYIETIKEMKKNSVERSAYEKLKQENSQLLDVILNGGSQEEQKAPEVNLDIAELKKNLNDDSLTNLQYCETALKLRKAVIESGGKDPFLPWGEKIAPTSEDEEAANRVAATLSECIEYAKGDSELFTNELQRRMIDASPIVRRK